MDPNTFPFIVLFLAIIIIVPIIILSKIRKKKKIEAAIISPSEAWKVSRYKDEFGHSTEESYIVNNEELKGSFSNTATNYDKLTLWAYFDKNRVSFRFYTYGNCIFKNAYGHDKEFEVLFLSDAGEKYSTIGIQPAYSSDIYLPSDISNTITEILRNSRKIEFIVRNNTNVFKFNLYNENFSELYDEIYVPGSKLWINGNYIGKIQLSGNPSKEETEKYFLKHKELSALLNGKSIKKIFYLPNGYNILIPKK